MTLPRRVVGYAQRFDGLTAGEIHAALDLHPEQIDAVYAALSRAVRLGRLSRVRRPPRIGSTYHRPRGDT